MTEKRKKKTIADIIETNVDRAYQILDWNYKSSCCQDLHLDNTDKGVPEDYLDYNHARLEKIVDLVKPLITIEQQTKKIKASSARDIIKLIGKGEVTLKEAKELIKLLDDVVETDVKEMRRDMLKGFTSGLIPEKKQLAKS